MARRKKVQKPNFHKVSVSINASKLRMRITPQWKPTQFLGDVFFSHMWTQHKGTHVLWGEWIASTPEPIAKIEKEEDNYWGVKVFDIYGPDPKYFEYLDETYTDLQEIKEYTHKELLSLFSNQRKWEALFAWKNRDIKLR